MFPRSIFFRGVQAKIANGYLLLPRGALQILTDGWKYYVVHPDLGLCYLTIHATPPPAPSAPATGENSYARALGLEKNQTYH